MKQMSARPIGRTDFKFCSYHIKSTSRVWYIDKFGYSVVVQKEAQDRDYFQGNKDLI